MRTSTTFETHRLAGGHPSRHSCSRSPGPRQMAPFALLALLLGGGCTASDGRAFGEVSAELRSHFAGTDPGSERLSEGWLKTADSFEVQLSAMTLELGSVTLRGSRGTSSGGGAVSGDTCTFDPQNPPAGCTLCHGGHCHCDGALVDYEELAARACGTSSSAGSAPAALATLPLAATPSLLAGGTRQTLEACTPSCGLGRGSVERVDLALQRLRLSAKVRDRSVADRLSGAVLDLTVDWALAGATLSATLQPAVTVARDTPYYLHLALDLALPATLLDGVAWHTLQRSGSTVTVSAAENAATGQALASALAKAPLKVTVQRSDD